MATSKLGAFTFVLHSHFPYCRRAGRWPHGEEWIHEGATETYIPLLNALYDLKEAGIAAHITIGLTPILVEQLADPTVLEHLRAYLDEKLTAAEGDLTRFDPESESQQHALAGFYVNWYRGIQRSLLERFDGDIVGAFRRLQDAGCIEIITCAATHGYLPLLARDASIVGQLRTAVRSYERHFGRRPRAIWLPECAYRPAYLAGGPAGDYRKPGIEEFLAAERLRLFFSETHAVEGGAPVGKAQDAVIGPYGAVQRRYVTPAGAAVQPTKKTTYRPYYVAQDEVAVIGRNNRTGMQVWSADWGYPGDATYREFHKKDGVSGMQYWRVTGPRLDLGQKDWYAPAEAEASMQRHARHYVGLVEELLTQYAGENAGDFGLIASNYDTELFGHWWFEGVSWLREVVRGLAGAPAVQLMTASEYLEAYPPQEVIALPESSWGAGGTHFTWDNADTHWMWAPIHAAERRMEALVERYPDFRSLELQAALNQAARELLLLQSSDWPFLVTTGQAGAYAIERFQNHVDRFNMLAEMLEAGAPDAATVRQYYELDNPFPDIDYRDFGRRDP